jgi:pyridoxamine 5'-phosphate oxidase family protein
MSSFTESEIRYMAERRLARVATTGKDGAPHVTPVGFRYNAEHDSIDVGGFDLERTKKFRDVERSGHAAVVIDDNPSVDPWRVRGIEVRGPARALRAPVPLIRIHPRRIISWGIETESSRDRHARTVHPSNA